jgi:hypothetical protein
MLPWMHPVADIYVGKTLVHIKYKLKIIQFVQEFHKFIVFNSWVVLHCVNVPHFLYHSSVEGHLGSFQLLSIIKKAAMNIAEHVSLLHVRASSGYMPRSGISGFSGGIMSSFLRNCQTDFQTVLKQKQNKTKQNKTSSTHRKTISQF